MICGCLSEAAATVETVGADLALGDSDCGDKIFEGSKFQRGEVVAFAYLLYHGFVLGCAGSGILLEVGVGVAFEFFDQSTGEQLHVALG